MDIINQKDCNVPAGNTGKGRCWQDVGIPRGIIYGPLGVDIPADSIESLKAAISTGILNDDPNLRFYPVTLIREPTDNTKAPTEQTFAGDGTIAITQEPAYDLSLQWTDGGLCLLNALRKSNGENRGFMVIDSFGQLIATKSETPGNIQFIDAYCWTNPFKWAVNTQAVAAYITRLVFEVTQVNENIAIIDFSNVGGLGYLQKLNGLQNVYLTQQAARALGVVKLSGTIGCTTDTIYDLFEPELAVVGAWRARNKATKKPIAISAVANDATDLAFQITLLTSDANYSAAANSVELALTGPTELDGLEVSGFESNWITQ